MHNSQHRINRMQERGQASVEFALISVILLLILYGILEVGRLIFINSEVENAAREGAQIAAINPRIPITGTNSLTEKVLAKMFVTDHSSVTVTCTGCGSYACAFCKVQVSVTAPWRTLVPILNFGNLTTLQSSSTKLIEAANPAPP